MSKTETKKKLTSTVAEAAITPKNRNLPTRKTVLNDHDAFMFERGEKLKSLYRFMLNDCSDCMKYNKKNFIF